MKNLKIKLIDKSDARPLFDFELRNKSWFEEFVPPRPKHYFDFEKFKNVIEILTNEQSRGECYLYVIYIEDTVVGRVNISSVKDGVGDIGYRVCKDFLGQGIASKSLDFLIKESRDRYNLLKLEAQTTLNNIASQKVLLNRGFKYTITLKSIANLHGQKVDLLCYELIL